MGWDYTKTSGKLGNWARVACQDGGGEIVGFIHIERRRWPAGATPSIYNYAEIARLRVNEDCRRQGIGTTLVRMAEDWARECGFDRISVETSANGMHEFWEAVGYGPCSIIRDKQL